MFARCFSRRQRLVHSNAFNVAAWLPLVGSGLAALLWLRTFVSKTVAAGCAALYMMMPYHLAIDMYRRCAIPECWAFAWMPLVLYFTVGVIARKQRDLIGLSITFALLIFSHLISLAMFFWIPLGLAMLLSRPNQRIRSVLRVAFAMGLGTIISSVYLLPALANARYIPVSRLLSLDNYRWSNNLLILGPGLFIHYAHENFLQTVSWTVVSMIAVVAICGLSVLKWRAFDAREIVLFWIVVCGFSVFMMSRMSGPICAPCSSPGRCNPISVALQRAVVFRGSSAHRDVFIRTAPQSRVFEIRFLRRLHRCSY